MDVTSINGGIPHERVEIQASMMAPWIAADLESTLDPVLDLYKRLKAHRKHPDVPRAHRGT